MSIELRRGTIAACFQRFWQRGHFIFKSAPLRLGKTQIPFRQ
jgi:hypothetical protein